MRQSHSVLLGLLPWLTAASPIAEPAAQSKRSDSISNANHIFNSIHDSMRQFGSSLNHNGMGVFIATVPEDTELYHGTHNPYRVNGTEWLAFEPEHSMLFARMRGPPGRGGPGRRPGGGGSPGEGPPSGAGPGEGPPGEGGPGKGAPGQSPPSKDHQLEDAPGNAFPRPKVEDVEENGFPNWMLRHPYNERPEKEDGPQMAKESHPKDNKKHHSKKAGCHSEEKDTHHKEHPKSKMDKINRIQNEGGDDQSREVSEVGPGASRKALHDGRPHDSDSGHHRGPPPHGGEGDHHRGPPPHGKKGDRHHGPPPPEPFEHHRGHPPPVPHPEPFRGIVGAISRLFGHQEPISREDNFRAAHEDEIDTTEEDEQSYGYVHTYRTKHALRLLYLDGQSAAKSTKGTLDVQDMIIRNTSDSGEGRGMFGEKERADEMCRVAREEWDSRIDGILRMEGGFEIILCSFEKDVDVVRILPFKSSGGPGGPGGRDNEDQFSYYEAVAARYDGIGADRVKVDYDNFVTLFAYPNAVYFDKTGRPRVRNDSAEISIVREDITKMVLGDDSKTDAVNWQQTTDQIVTRYADRIEYMASSELETAHELKAEIERAIRPFIDYSSRNATLEAERCATQFWPSNVGNSNVAGWAVKETYQTLCSSLAFAAQADHYKTAFAMITELKEYLAWPTWKRCRGCGPHEVCLLPIWPMGSEEDFVQPVCASPKTLEERPGGYWRGMRGPHSRHETQ